VSFTWIELEDVLAMQPQLIEAFGGAQGVRDASLIESALARPQNLAAYGEPDAAELAASYAFGLAKNHGFVDGNKRIAWAAARTFLIVNDVEIAFDQIDATQMTLKLAAGEISEEQLAAWFRERIA
jgi:death-on-curing protein